LTLDVAQTTACGRRAGDYLIFYVLSIISLSSAKKTQLLTGLVLTSILSLMTRRLGLARVVFRLLNSLMENNVTYVSASGLEDMKKELENRIKVLRPEIAGRISEAKEMGDLSENFAYHEARDQQGQNEGRIVQLIDMLSKAVVVEEKSGGSIGLGSRFTAKIGGKEKMFEVVGENEASPMDGKISNVSPLGAAFLGKSIGEKVEAKVPSGTMVYEIIEIK
jgi:transcription elongation factor GreA